MTDLEIGEYTGCTHGAGGDRKFGCIPCAIAWHTRRHIVHAEAAKRHLAMARRLEDEQTARKLETL